MPERSRFGMSRSRKKTQTERQLSEFENGHGHRGGRDQRLRTSLSAFKPEKSGKVNSRDKPEEYLDYEGGHICCRKPSSPKNRGQKPGGIKEANPSHWGSIE